MSDLTLAIAGVSASGQINSVGAPGIVALTLPTPTLMVASVGAVPAVSLTLPAPKLTVVGSLGVSGDVALTLPTPVLAISTPGVALALPTPILSASGQSGVIGSAALTLPAPRLAAAGPNTARLALPMPVLACAGTTGIAGGVILTAPVPQLTAQGTVPNAVNAALVLPVPTLAIAGGVGQAAQVAVALRSLALAMEGYTGTLGEVALALPLVHLSSGGYGAIAGAVQLTLPHLQLVATGERPALVPGATVSNTVVMHTEAMALSTYSNFPFNSFAAFNGVYLGAYAGGIFMLGGDVDAGAMIQAAARVGITDFSTSYLKRLDRVYVGYRTDGNLVLRVITDEVDQRDYRLPVQGKTGLHGNHTRLGKGLEARYWQFEVRNQGGAYFDLNMIEVKPTKLRRRVGGRDA